MTEPGSRAAFQSAEQEFIRDESNGKPIGLDGGRCADEPGGKRSLHNGRSGSPLSHLERGPGNRKKDTAQESGEMVMMG